MKYTDTKLDNTGANGVINGNGSLDVETLTAMVEWVKPLDLPSNTLMTLYQGTKYKMSIVFNLAKN